MVVGVTVDGSGVVVGCTVGGFVDGLGVVVGAGVVVGLCGVSLGCVRVTGMVALIFVVLPVSLALPLCDGWD